MIVGPRQVGKTTFMKHMSSSSNRAYVTLDDPLARDLARNDPALFLQRFPPPILIDEIQYAPQLFPLIKILVDQEQKAGMFWLTGSQQFSLMQNVSESLAGRVGLLRLLGLSYREQIDLADSSPPFLPTPDYILRAFQQAPALDLQSLYNLIWRGSFPRIALNHEVDHEVFYSSYLQTYLQRDVRDLTQVGDERSFVRFLRAAAARTGQLLNLSDLARDADIAPNTAKRWLSILVTSCIVYLLEPYHNNLVKRLTKAPKLYFLDTGLCCYLTGWSSPQTLEVGAMSGAILETYVVTEVLKSYWHNGRDAPIYFYRDEEKHEIDLLIVQDNLLYPLEIKKTASPRRDDIRHFSVLKGLYTGPGGIICLCSQPLPITDSLQSIPISVL